MFQFKTEQERQEFDRLTFTVQLLAYLLGLAHLVIAGKPMVITAAIDANGGHSPTGMHPKGRAFDVRAKDKNDAQKGEFWSVVKVLVGLLGGRPLWEDRGSDNEHFHIGI